MTRALWLAIESRLDAELPDWRRRVAGFRQLQAYVHRLLGRKWTDNETFEALLMAILSSNTDWSRVETVQDELRQQFSGFSLEAYANLPESEIGERIVPWFEARKAGAMTLKSNLTYLARTARILLAHSRDHGSAERYFTAIIERCDGDPKPTALHLGFAGKFKLPAFGVALATEALKNLGFNVAKPDRHVMRAVGSFGLVQFKRWPGRDGRKAPQTSSKDSLLAVMTAVEEIANAAGVPAVFADNAIFLLCAKTSGLSLSNPELAEIARTSGCAGEWWSPEAS